MPKKDIPKIYVGIGNKIKALRTKRKFTQMDLAYKSELTLSALSNVERAKKRVSVESLEKLGKALGVHISEFFK